MFKNESFWRRYDVRVHIGAIKPFSSGISERNWPIYFYFSWHFVNRTSKAKMAPKTMPQDSFVTDGKSKTKDQAQFNWLPKFSRTKVRGNLKLNKFQWSHDQMERVETTIDATSFVGHVGESLSSFCNNSLFSDVLIRIGANAYGELVKTYPK